MNSTRWLHIIGQTSFDPNQLQADSVCACEDILPNRKRRYTDKNSDNADFFPDDHKIWMSPNHLHPCD